MGTIVFPDAQSETHANACLSSCAGRQHAGTDVLLLLVVRQICASLNVAALRCGTFHAVTWAYPVLLPLLVARSLPSADTVCTAALTVWGIYAFTCSI